MSNTRFLQNMGCIAALCLIACGSAGGAIFSGGELDDEQTSIGYDAATGEVFVAASISTELTSIRIASTDAIFTAEPADNLTLPPSGFDVDEDGVIFKSVIGGSFGSLSFGNVAQRGLSRDFLLTDLDVTGSLAGGGELGSVDLIYLIPEPTGLALVLLCAIPMSMTRSGAVQIKMPRPGRSLGRASTAVRS